MEQLFYGGAMVGMLPHDAQDMSLLREIPDNQEVFAHAKTDQSIIIEIMEYVQEPDEVALRIHFEELAESNDASGCEKSCIQAAGVLDLSQISLKECKSVYWLTGQQLVSKFKESALNNVNIHMVLFRLPTFMSDILVTFNDPINVNPESSSHHPMSTETVPWTMENFWTLINSLTLLDSGLFGEDRSS
ncbi:hypothetical protein C0Q70_06839 [Pomacea canaliculata]|uniref:Ran guanine nucleotide release factor n=1 Tax=Pomacea canaliculata TaxID=400727 RepID=A0A2T7PDC8_POMCA|nr:ran guanine nucleotide release factor-like [Pomacea canaliculata]XP_025089049.1 ran guanine nucleotide release factor-like [Pomacea canaliculata]XP_025089050.1 ran guanine nucleotide release factor-like [Pomacea canaliculata]PVD31427.1 hypothetical protein C0Q70_06839 [Pomacea canaliculata]